ncbi:MAG: SAM-dependent methyltransferase [Ilumatobacteraceae bacterium]
MTGALHHDRAYFEAMYSERHDPWGFDDRWYERRKFALTIASLPQARYRRAYEPGCANGALSELLADRCEELIAAELLDEVAARARARLAVAANVEVVTGSLPQYWPAGTGDLVVWSEIAYYLTDAGAQEAIDGLDAWLEPGGDLLAVHYTGTTDYPRSGTSIVPWLDGVAFLDRLLVHTDEQFELALWRRPRSRSGQGSDDSSVPNPARNECGVSGGHR